MSTTRPRPGRPELVGLQAYRLSYVIVGRKHQAEALDLAMSAAAGLERVMRDPDVDTLSVYGARSTWPACTLPPLFTTVR